MSDQIPAELNVTNRDFKVKTAALDLKLLETQKRNLCF